MSGSSIGKFYHIRDYQVSKLKETSIKVLYLLFLNTTLWLGGSFLFMHLEATNEAEHKCGVKKVQRDFVDILWQESQSLDEFDWKSSARQRIMKFEDQIHEAVQAGVSSSSGNNVWNIPNTFVYVFTLSTTIGYGHMTPSDPTVRLISICYAMISIPLLTSLVSNLASAITLLLNILTNMDKDNYVPLSCPSLIILLAVFTTSGAALFAVLYDWNIAESIYFVFSTVSTVGFGDILPGDSLTFLMAGGYVLMGLAIFSLYQESFSARVDGWLSGLLTQRKINGKDSQKEKSE